MENAGIAILKATGFSGGSIRSIFMLIAVSIGILFSLITTSLAGWFPAQKASSIDPVIIIRGK